MMSGKNPGSFISATHKIHLLGTPMKTETITAHIIAGRGLAKERRAGDIKKISEKYGLSLTDGSLNLISKSPLWLDTQTAIYTNGEGHFYWHGDLNGTPVIVNRWVWSCPAHVFEIFAEDHLRSKFDLSDGDPVELELSAECIDQSRNRSLLNRFIWTLAWRGRERFIYQDGIYRGFIFLRYIHKLLGTGFQQR